MSNYLEMTKEQFLVFNALPDDIPLSMLNLLKYKAEVPEIGGNGEDRYKDYMKAVEPYFVKSGARVTYAGKAHSTLIGPNNEWDKILIVEYARKKDFVNMIMSEGYPTHIRNQALSDSRLIFCESLA